MKAGKLTAGFCLTVLLTATAAVTSMAAPGTSGDWRQEQDGRWYYYDEEGTMCTGWIEVGGKHYYLYEDGHCAMNEITPDGFRVDADGAWYEQRGSFWGRNSLCRPDSRTASAWETDGVAHKPPSMEPQEDKRGFRREKEAVD